MAIYGPYFDVQQVTHVITSFVKDLLTMIRGLVGGMMTLGWAIVLFLLVVYIVALLFREASEPWEHYTVIPQGE